MTINLGDDYRLRPMDKLNWVLEQRRIPTGNRAKSDKPKWYQTGNYFQRLDAALSYVYDHKLIEVEGEYDLFDAIKQAEKIAYELTAYVGKEITPASDEGK